MQSGFEWSGMHAQKPSALRRRWTTSEVRRSARASMTSSSLELDRNMVMQRCSRSASQERRRLQWLAI